MTAANKPRIAIFGKALAEKAMAMAEAAGAEVFLTNAYLQGGELQDFLSRHRPDAIILRLGRVDEAAMAAAPGLKIIAKHGVGYDTIDLEAADRRDILVSIAAGGNAISVAEHALALMLGVARGISHLDARMRGGHWDKATYLGTELNGKSLGIVGIGAIGRHLATICRGLGMEVIVFDPAASGELEPEFKRVPRLEDLLEASDVVSLHCPLTPATRNMISTDQFVLMKPRSILINTARGGLVDHEAAVSALESGQIGGAGFDTFPEEPPTLDTALIGLPNVVLSPHVGASTFEAGTRVGELAMGQVLDYLAGKSVDGRYIVNKVAGQRSVEASA